MQTGARTTHVHEAQLRLAQVDPAEVGAAVTTALCGHWGHEGPCRWPHHNHIEPADGPGADLARFRTVFVARPAEESEVRALVEAALAGDERWVVVRSGARDLDDDERTLGARLAQTPEP